MKNIYARTVFVGLFVLLCNFAIAQTTITIGNGTTGTANFPINRYYNYSTWEAIYLKSEINVAGDINEIKFYKTNTDNGINISSVTVYLKHTTQTTFNDGYYSTTGYTQVYSGTITNSSTSGWKTITLNQPFSFNNVENLSVLIVHNYQTYTSNYPLWRNTILSTTKNRRDFNDNSQPDYLTATTGRADMQLVINTCNKPIANAGANQATCNNGSVFIGGTPSATGGSGSGYTYLWTPSTGLSSSVNSNPSASPAITTTYSLQVTDGSGCVSLPSTVIVTPNTSSTIYNSSGTTNKTFNVCAGQFYDSGTNNNYSGAENYTITFYPCEVNKAVKVNFQNFNTESGYDYLYVYNGQNTNAPLLGTYSGTTSPGIIIADNPTGTLTFRFSSDYGVTSTGWQATISCVVPCVKPTVHAGSDVNICYGTSTAIGGNPTATGGSGSYTYLWTPSTGLTNATNSNPSASPTITTNYIVQVTDNTGCSNKDTITVSVGADYSEFFMHYPDPAYTCTGYFYDSGGPYDTYGYDEDYTRTFYPCQTGKKLQFNFTSFNLEAQTNCTYDYLEIYNGPSTSSPLIGKYCGTNSPGIITSTHATGALTFKFHSDVSVENNGWIASISCINPLVLTANTNPSCTNSCNGSATVTATGGTTPYVYTWNTTPQQTTATANNLCVGTYSVTVSDVNNLTTISNVTVTGYTAPVANAGTDQSICSGNNTNLSASGGIAYSWNPSTGLSATNISNPVANPTATTTYTVSVTDSHGCSATDNVLVTVNSLPSANVGSNQLLCFGQSANLSASGGASYSWSPATGLSATNIYNPIASPLTTTTYIVTVTGSNGCFATDSLTITVVPMPIPNAGNDTAICLGNSVQLNATGGEVYFWSPSTGLSSAYIPNPVASPTVTTTYFISAINQNKCTKTDSVTITVNTIPIVNADTMLVQYLATGDMATNGGTPPYTFTWLPYTPAALPDTATTFTLIVTDSKGCKGRDSVTYIPSPNTGACGGLFISEYIQDTLNHNVAIELYNPTANVISLNHYFLNIVSNGSINMIGLSDSIAAYSTFVIANSHADTSLTNHANMLSDTLNFNGKNIVFLTYISQGVANTLILDKIGDIYTTPGNNGWPVGSGSTRNNTLIRQFSNVQGNPDWQSCQNEWDVYPRGTFSHLGNFKNVCTPGDPHLSYTFKNQQTICDSSKYEFDIMAQADASTIFNSTVIRISYSAAEFGDSIVSRGGVTVTRDTAFFNYSTPVVSDYSDGVIQIVFGDSATQTTSGSVIINSSYTKILHISMLKLSPLTSMIEFTDTTETGMLSKFTTATRVNDSTYNYSNINYSSTIYSDGLTSSPCLIDNTLGLTLRFQNPAQTMDTVTHKKYFEFDVEVKASEINGNYLNSFQFFIKYDTLSFGPKAHFIIQLDSLFNGITYNSFWTGSTTRNVFSSNMKVQNPNPSPNRIELPTTFVKLAHYSVEIVSCFHNSGLFFDPEFPGHSFFTFTDSASVPVSLGNSLSYPTYLNKMDSIKLCETNIFSFTKTVYPGTWYHGTTDENWKMEIQGIGFGRTRGSGNVWFVNANSPLDSDPSRRYTLLNGNDILLWGDSLIRIRMPSRVDTSLYNLQAGDVRLPGSGKFYIKTNNAVDSIMSPTPVKMPYGIRNWNYLGKQRMNLANIANDSTGIIFRLSENIVNYPNPMAKVAAKRAVYEWACRVRVNFIVDTIPTQKTTSSVDGENVIHFVNSFSNPKTLSEASISPSSCLNTNHERIFFLNEVDIAILRDPSTINAGTSWYFDTSGTALPSNHYDFFEVVQHEVGHGVLLTHVVDTFSLMYWTTMFNQTTLIPQYMRRFPIENDVFGGQDVIEKSTSTVFDTIDCGTYSATIVDYSRIPCGNGNAVAIINDKIENVNIYPNPFNDEGFNILYKVTKSSYMQINIFDFNGRKIQQSDIKKQNEGIFQEHIEVSKLCQGIYFIVINLNGKVQACKLIKVK